MRLDLIRSDIYGREKKKKVGGGAGTLGTANRLDSTGSGKSGEWREDEMRRKGEWLPKSSVLYCSGITPPTLPLPPSPPPPKRTLRHREAVGIILQMHVVYVRFLQP